MYMKYWQLNKCVEIIINNILKFKMKVNLKTKLLKNKHYQVTNIKLIDKTYLKRCLGDVIFRENN